MGKRKRENIRLAYPPCLRILGAAGVILIHVTSASMRAEGITAGELSVLLTLNALARFSVPAFVMISGALLLHPRRTFKLARFYRTHLIRLAFAYVLWSAVYAVQRGIRDPSAFLGQVIKGEYHLWYLKMICILYLLTPFFRAVMKRRALTSAFLLIWLVLDVCILTVLGGHASSPYLLSAEYAGYYILGGALETWPVRQKVLRRALYAAGILSFPAAAALAVHRSQAGGQLALKALDFLGPFTLLEAAALFIFLQNHVKKEDRRIRAISECTFGIYLAHILFLNWLGDAFHMTALSFFPVAAAPLMTALLFGMSLLLVLLFRKVPVFRRAV